jgi:hypothetical protein
MYGLNGRSHAQLRSQNDRSYEPSLITSIPRGRIVYHIKTRHFILYADRRLQQEDTIASIADKFGLVPGSFIVRSDAHYRS